MVLRTGSSREVRGTRKLRCIERPDEVLKRDGRIIHGSPTFDDLASAFKKLHFKHGNTLSPEKSVSIAVFKVNATPHPSFSGMTRHFG